MALWILERAVSRGAAVCFVAVLIGGCGGGECTWYAYAPPSARVKVRDAMTGDLLCEPQASTDRGPAIQHKDLCELWIPVWFPDADAGPSVTLTVEGYEPKEITFPVKEDECGHLEQPPMQTVEVNPAPE